MTHDSLITQKAVYFGPFLGCNFTLGSQPKTTFCEKMSSLNMNRLFRFKIHKGFKIILRRNKKPRSKIF